MPVRHASNTSALRHTPLIAGLALALSLNLSVARAADSASAAIEPRDLAPAIAPAGSGGAKEAAWQWGRAHRPHARPTTTLAVSHCDDSGPGSLRQAVFNAVSGDTIDLAALACSRITLSTGVITVSVNDLTINGPGARELTIDGAASASHPHSVFYHFGSGMLALTGVTVTGGFYTGSALPSGGCIHSKGDVYLKDSMVTGCTVQPAVSGSMPKGGGVYAKGQLITKYSTISNNAVIGNSLAAGGAAYAGGGLLAKYSTFSDNRAIAEGTGKGNAGGVAARGNVTIMGSTISGNHASRNISALGIYGGATGDTATISNSTISGNTAGNVIGGVFTNIPLTLRNSTIAFNRAGTANCAPLYGYPSCDAGLHVSFSNANLQSTIIANNKGSGAPADISLLGSGTVAGAGNLVIAPHVALPFDTIFSDPKLYPLASNGGPTRTHALRPGSPAIDAGNNAAKLDYDQRGLGYARQVGFRADIGAFERQGADDPDYVFIDGFDGI